MSSLYHLEKEIGAKSVNEKFSQTHKCLIRQELDSSSEARWQFYPIAAEN